MFNAEKVAYLAGLIGEADARFDGAGFERDVMAEMLPLELKARMQLIARVLEQYLPDDFAKAVSVIEAALQTHRWNRTATAKSLGITLRSLRYRLKKLGIED